MSKEDLVKKALVDAVRSDDIHEALKWANDESVNDNLDQIFIAYTKTNGGMAYTHSGITWGEIFLLLETIKHALIHEWEEELEEDDDILDNER